MRCSSHESACCTQVPVHEAADAQGVFGQPEMPAPEVTVGVLCIFLLDTHHDVAAVGVSELYIEGLSFAAVCINGSLCSVCQVIEVDGTLLGIINWLRWFFARFPFIVRNILPNDFGSPLCIVCDRSCFHFVGTSRCRCPESIRLGCDVNGIHLAGGVHDEAVCLGGSGADVGIDDVFLAVVPFGDIYCHSDFLAGDDLVALRVLSCSVSEVEGVGIVLAHSPCVADADVYPVVINQLLAALHLDGCFEGDVRACRVLGVFA